MRHSALASFSSQLVVALAIGACTNTSDPQAVSAATKQLTHASEIHGVVGWRLWRAGRGKDNR